ncbi:MAG TPA: lycopene cyclase domain-containing protein [Longimicrobiales bacterium]|nr:lycopene cyclase domain-containing protein [Longimicrobiales bacterium]
MTYLQFHLVFMAPPLLVLAALVWRAPERLGSRALWTLPAVALIALVYTTPWDNYLVYRGIWWYGTDRVMGTIGYVPVEEYMFFLLQPLLAGAWTYLLLMRMRSGPEDREAWSSARVRTGRAGGDATRDAVSEALHDGLTLSLGSVRAVGVGIYLVFAAAGVLALTFERGLYLGLILAWAAPVLAAQWIFAGPALARAPGVFAAAVGVPTLYLWVADRIAIGAGIWSISPQYTTGLHLLGLPIEEALFFLVTNVLVVQGVVLFLQPNLVALPAAGGARALAPSRVA